MTRIFTLGILLLISLVGQGQYLKMATLSSSGGTVSKGGNCMSYVLGQSSVISGTVKSQGIMIRQGFKQPFGLQKTKERTSLLQIFEEESPWSYVTFPNPFVDRLTVRFDRPTANPIVLQVYDIQGKVLWQDDYAAQTQEIMLEKFQAFKAGKYILQVIQKGKTMNQSLIKLSN
jgi:hypothetical protein